MKKLTIWTARIDYQAKGEQVVLNTTIGSGEGHGLLFAPTWKLVRAIKFKKITWDQYREGYLALMRKQYRENKPQFHEVCESGEIVLCCYCSVKKKGRQCHRFLLADVLKSVAEKDLKMEVEMGGELLNYTNRVEHQQMRHARNKKRPLKRST